LTIILLGLAALSCGVGGHSARFPTTVTTYAGRDGSFGEPFGIAVRDGQIYVSDGKKDCIWKIDQQGRSAVFASGLNTPSQLAFLPDGSLIVADTGSNTIRSIDSGGVSKVIAGIIGEAGDNDGAATEAASADRSASQLAKTAASSSPTRTTTEFA